MSLNESNNIKSILQFKNFDVVSSNSDRCNNSVNTSNTQEIESKSLDTYFGITEKSPSPSINSEIDEEEIELNINDTLTLTEIKSRIENLYETELVEIYRIIKSNGEKYTINNNGIFVNICNLKPITVSEITKFLIYSETKNKEIDKEEEERDLYRVIVS